ncbi:hypothetical protein [Flavobacterium sp. UBA7663]|uniref:hypothetical protein n=1 Tax=Flavobacterium sp. UBA7663 TaxID=1946557 RepID=UPI0025C4A054|nr:hypothetical protein [Flavobacterium sp. UBA7663]
MSIQKLAEKELQLNSIVISLKGTIEEKEAQIFELKLPEEFKKLHFEYAELSNENVEAIKRGLFLYWFSLSEPMFLTGICEIDQVANRKIITNIEKIIDADKIDYELSWMLSYYKEWDWIFDNYKSDEKFYNALLSSNVSLPKINKGQMLDRGLMGKYWNSLN